MFLPSILLLVPMILSTGSEVQINNNYVVKFSSEFTSTVDSIEVIGYRSEELNLSGLSIASFTGNAFKNVSHIRTLNISNNIFFELRNTPFVSLTNLEYLDLSHNIIYGMRKPFIGLSNLKILDLSDNNLRYLHAGYFFGLSPSCVILLNENIIKTMSTELFEYNTYSMYEPIDAEPDDVQPVNESERTHHLKESIGVCINDTILISVEHYTEGEKLARGCRKHIYYEFAADVLELSLSRIAKFQKKWYKLKVSDINYIDLRHNEITHLASEMFNDLSENVKTVNLSFNEITRLEKGVIVNKHLRLIDFAYNNLIEIEDNVFINTNLTGLYLMFNKLKDTKFAATLPETLEELRLSNNKINKIFRDSFSKLNKLKVLVLDSNNIKVIRRDSLRGLSGLKNLALEYNGMLKIEAGSFQDLTKLEKLTLNYNDFLTLDSGVFNGLKNLSYLGLEGCNITRIEKGAFENSGKLCQLVLAGNPIAKLENGTLHGLMQELEECFVDLESVPIEIIHAGVFVRSDN